jgi:hypothetical protein
MSDLTKPHDRDAMFAKLRRKPKPQPRESPRDAEMATRRDAEMAAFRSAVIPPRATDAALKAAGRELVNRLAQIGKDHLKAHPDDELGELAVAVSDVGGLVPLFDAISAEMGATRCGHGFLLRFVEGVLDVVQIAGVDAVKKIRSANSEGGKNGGGKKAREDAEKWMSLALPFAQKQRELNPAISQEDLATEIKYHFDLKRGIAQIKIVIRGWEDEGKLTPTKRKAGKVLHLTK